MCRKFIHQCLGCVFELRGSAIPPGEPGHEPGRLLLGDIRHVITGHMTWHVTPGSELAWTGQHWAKEPGASGHPRPLPEGVEAANHTQYTGEEEGTIDLSGRSAKTSSKKEKIISTLLAFI